MTIAAGRREGPLLCIVRIVVSMAGRVKRNQLNKIVGVFSAATRLPMLKKFLSVAGTIHIDKAKSKSPSQKALFKYTISIVLDQ